MSIYIAEIVTPLPPRGNAPFSILILTPPPAVPERASFTKAPAPVGGCQQSALGRRGLREILKPRIFERIILILSWAFSIYANDQVSGFSSQSPRPVGRCQQSPESEGGQFPQRQGPTLATGTAFRTSLICHRNCCQLSQRGRVLMAFVQLIGSRTLSPGRMIHLSP